VAHITFVQNGSECWYQTGFAGKNLAINIAIGLVLTTAVALASEYFIRRRNPPAPP
jgi:hypothetical protein